MKPRALTFGFTDTPVQLKGAIVYPRLALDWCKTPASLYGEDKPFYGPGNHHDQASDAKHQAEAK